MTTATRRRARAGSVRLAAPAAGRAGPWRASRPRLSRRAGLAALLLAVSIAVAALVLASPLLAVRDARVEGAGRLAPAQVLAAAQVPTGSPMARLPVRELRRRVATLPVVAGVDAVSVTRRWPHTVVLTVRERAAALAVPQPDGSWQLVDGTGRAFAGQAEAPPGLPRLQVAAPDAAPDAASDEVDGAARAAAAVVLELPPWLRGQVLQVAVCNGDSVTLSLRNRTVIWGPAGPAGAAKAAAVAALLTRPQKTIDVSSPSVAVSH